MGVVQPDDVAPILALKAAAKYLSRETEAMQAVAKALKERSLELFEKTLKDYSKGELRTTSFIWESVVLIDISRTPYGSIDPHAFGAAV
jgi:hypothetical protein